MIQEAWEITKGDERTQDRLENYILFCEDETDEPHYFSSFQVAGKLKVSCVPNQKKTKLNLSNTLAYCYKEGLLEYKDHVYSLREGVTENIWCVYDRDVENDQPNDQTIRGDMDFTGSIKLAKDAGIKVAWSNDAFELWILLHFEAVPAGVPLHRNYIYQRLTDIFSQDERVRAVFENAIGLGVFNYKIHLKRRKHFINYVLPLLKERMAIATQRAIELQQRFDGNVPYHRCCPCTLVYALAEELRVKGLQ